ncbi:BREX-2 system phosphatase PglZ [Dietzia aurantiaca]|uniref:BREX-2 system phosphatase PglZ n=1 Tax=Dietzia aurantiaca TaxID=983873 RepID=A0ABV9PKR1_9ACTN
MTTRTLGTATAADITALVSGLYRDKQQPRGLLVIHARPEWDGPAEVVVEGLSVPVHCCRTVLELRDVVRRRHDAAVPWRVILTDLRDDEIPQGVREHFRPVGRSLELDPASTLLGLFSAKRTGGGIPRRIEDVRGMVDALAPHRDSLSPTSTPVLTAEHLYSALATHCLQLDDGTRLAGLLAWSASPRTAEAWEHVAETLTETVRSDLVAWIVRRHPLTGSALQSLWLTSGPGALFPAGFVAETLGASGDLAVPRALFRQHVGVTQNDAALREWGRAAAAAARRELDQGRSIAPAVVEGQRLLSGIESHGSVSLVGHSTVLPEGFRRRIDEFARALSACLSSGAEGPLLQSLSALEAHIDGAGSRSGDVETATALVRLARWNRSESERAVDRMRTTALPNAMNHYVGEVSWVDRAVNAAWRGFTTDPKPPSGQSEVDPDALSQQVLTRTLTARRDIDRAFAALAASQLSDSTRAGDALLVENVLSAVVKPLHQAGPIESDKAVKRPLLVLVIDGLSVPAAHSLADDLAERHSTVWQSVDLAAKGLHVAATALPSITAASRTSLLCGELTMGDQNTEKKGFADHVPGATLFHKGDLDAGISDLVRQTVYDTKGSPVVGAILNTIDDALDRSETIATTWTTQRITHMDKLLDYARAVGRDVVLLSDHGHVVERSQTSKTSVEGAVSSRWRPAGYTPETDGERTVAGDRVLTETHTAILAVDADIRYTSKKAGYHGGLSPAEICAPVAVLVQNFDGLGEGSPFPAAPPLQASWPGWWDIHLDAPAVAQSLATTPAKPSRPSASPKMPPATALQDSLFDTTPPPEPAPRADDRYSSLASMPFFKEQVATHRVGLKPRALADTLRAIDHNNRRMPITGLAARLELDAIRIRGTLARMQKVVNIDGMPVLEQEGSDVVLAPEVLFEQFGVTQ